VAELGGRSRRDHGRRAPEVHRCRPVHDVEGTAGGSGIERLRDPAAPGLRGLVQLHEERDPDPSGGKQDQRDRFQQVRGPAPVRGDLRENPERSPERGQCRGILYPPGSDPVHGGPGGPEARRVDPRPGLRYRRVPGMCHRECPQIREDPQGRGTAPEFDPRRREETDAAPALHHEHDAPRHRCPDPDPPGQHPRPPAEGLLGPGPGGRDRDESAVRRHGGGRDRDELPRNLPDPRDRRSLPRPDHAPPQGRRQGSNRPPRRHALWRGRQEPDQGETPDRVQPPHHRPAPERRLRPLHRDQNKPALLRERQADKRDLVLRAHLSRGRQVVQQDQANPYRGVRAREGVVDEPHRE